MIPKPTAHPYDAPEVVEPFGEERNSTKAVISLVLGLGSFVCCFFTGIPAVILGILGLNEISAAHGRIKGRGMALTGIITGSLGTVLSLTFIPIALLLPAVQAAREAARRAQCVNNLKQIGLAMANFESANGRFPDAAITDPRGRPLLSWRVALLPYLEQQGLYEQFHLDEPWDSPHNKTLLSQMPKVFHCPSDPTEQAGSASGYTIYVGRKAVFRIPRSITLRQITDGTSNTVLVVESKEDVPWTKPADLPFDPDAVPALPESYHPGGSNALFADFAVRFLKGLTGAQVRALITPDGGEVIAPNQF